MPFGHMHLSRDRHRLSKACRGRQWITPIVDQAIIRFIPISGRFSPPSSISVGCYICEPCRPSLWVHVGHYCLKGSSDTWTASSLYLMGNQISTTIDESSYQLQITKLSDCYRVFQLQVSCCTIYLALFECSDYISELSSPSLDQ